MRREALSLTRSRRLCIAALCLLASTAMARAFLWPDRATLAQAWAGGGGSEDANLERADWAAQYEGWAQSELRAQYESLSAIFIEDAERVLDHQEALGESLSIPGPPHEVGPALAATGKSAIHWRLRKTSEDPPGVMRLYAVFAEDQPPLEDLYRELAWLRRQVHAQDQSRPQETQGSERQ